MSANKEGTAAPVLAEPSEIDRADAAVATEQSVTESSDEPTKRRARISWRRGVARGLLPGLTLALAAGAGYAKWQDDTMRAARTAATVSVSAAADGTIALLSYKPETVDKDMGAARDRLTGAFRDAYTSLTHDVVIPGAKQKQITAVATVPAAASVSASPTHAVVLVFVDQTVTVGNVAPTNTASSVLVGLDKVGDRWLISRFDPV